MKLRHYRTLVVCASQQTGLLGELRNHGWNVWLATSGQAAVNLARRIRFDPIILISTDDDMDVAETLFNLRDVQGSAQLVCVVPSDGEGGDLNDLCALFHARLVSMAELSGYLEAL